MDLTRAAGVYMLAASLLGIEMMARGQGALSVSVTATYRERIALPPDAVLEATLEDVTRVDAASRVIGSTRVERPGSPPFHFSIRYDPSQIMPAHIYAVRARVTEGGRLLFTTDQQYQVLTQGHGSDVAMMLLRSVSGSPAGAQPTATAVPLRETYWKLAQLGGKPVTAADQQQEANLVFRTEGSRVTGSSGCNRLTGMYAVNGHALRFNGVASTRMACMRGMDTEAAFLGALEKVRAWRINGQQLDLYDANGKLLARFIAQAMK